MPKGPAQTSTGQRPHGGCGRLGMAAAKATGEPSWSALTHYLPPCPIARASRLGHRSRSDRLPLLQALAGVAAAAGGGGNAHPRAR